MSLIKCPGCGKEVSPRASACPQCGEPITPQAAVVPQEAKHKPASPAAIGVAFAGLAVFIVIVSLVTCSSGGSSSGTAKVQEQVHEPGVNIDKVVGSYMNTDGLRMITIKEAYDDAGWNGRLSFSPAVGDWVKVLKCRVSDKDLVVEIPASETVIIKLFKLDGPDSITGLHSPWDGTYTRIR
jgi:hypothetical protein